VTDNGWLWRHLEETGAGNPDRIGRQVRATVCRTCHAPTLTGLDNDMCAGVAHADPTPLSPLGEALALLGGRNTYTLHQASGRLELQIRDQWQIQGSPAGTRHDVLPAHTCEAVDLPGAPSVRLRYAAALPDTPPY
jgi:hypothetical protein